MIAIIDYGAGNLFSVCNGLAFLGIDHVVTKDPAVMEAAHGIILPGVGAFADAMAMIQKENLVPILQQQAQKKPFLGICLGMQMLFDYGYEHEKTAGLGLIAGEVRLMEPQGLKIPHMGWNELTIVKPCALTKGIAQGDYVYFVHSYQAVTEQRYLSMVSEYGGRIPALVHKDWIYGAQFHPEKSGAVGLQMLRNFGGMVDDYISSNRY